ncbi:MAG: hypothetical protein ACE15C_06590 [Phycisphaerae bacterium]
MATMRLALAVCGAFVAVAFALGLASPARAAEGDNFFIWNWGSADDTDPAKVPHIGPADRIGEAGADGEIKYRLTKPVFQVFMTMPAFDFDAANYGAINHPFFLTIKFKDVSNKPTAVHAGKGGCGFYGAGYVGTFGGAADSQWKEETLIIPRSMMRCIDGKTFGLKFVETKAAVPVASLTLFSAETRLPGAKEKIAAAWKSRADNLEALRKKLLPQFKDLGLPDPGPCPDYTDAEKKRGFRVFFPPVSRQLFANSQPQEGELTDTVKLEACPGQTISLVVAVRALEDLADLRVVSGWQKTVVPLDIQTKAIRWAVYSEQRIGSSWGKDYRVCPEQLVLDDSHHAAKPDRVEIAVVCLKVPDKAAPGRRDGAFTVVAGKDREAAFNVQIDVLPFKLEHPDHSTHGQFYYIDYGDIDPFEVLDMADHGMDTVVSGLGASLEPGPGGKRNVEQSRKAFKFLKSAGYRAPLIDNTGYLGRLPDDAKNRKRYAESIAETMQIAREEGFNEMGFFPVDEPHTPDLIAKAKVACEWTKDVPGANTYITSNPNAVKVLDPVLNYVCYNLTYLNAETINSMKPHQKLMFYCPSIDVNPEYNRFRPGFYAFKINAFSSQYFAYMEFAGDPFCDLDGPNRDWNVCYPSMDSPTHDPTLEWEAMREGVYDWQYAYTLTAVARRAKAKGKTAEAVKAVKVLDDVLAAVDVDGKKAGGPAIDIEADVRLKDKKLDPKQLAEAKALVGAAWYDASRKKIAQAIVELKKVLGE